MDSFGIKCFLAGVAVVAWGIYYNSGEAAPECKAHYTLKPLSGPCDMIKDWNKREAISQKVDKLFN